MSFQADDKHVKILGRTRVIDGVRYLGYSCSSIEFVVTGTRAEAVLCSDSPSFEDIHKAWVAVFIDEEEVPSRRFPVEKSEASYVLFESENTKTVNIRLVKYSEAAFGKVGIKELRIDGQAPVPAQEKSRKLEFIGDSITCGYGNEGLWNVDSFSTAQENPYDAYAAIAAREVEADYHMICWSGIGIISNFTEQEVPDAAWLMPDLYPYTDKALDLSLGLSKPVLWDTTAFIPDCIIINLGTNDHSYTKDISERVAVFEEKYYEFVKQVRSNNPASTILCTLGAMGQNLCPSIEKQVERLIEEGDRRLYYMSFNLQEEADGIGTDWHPSKITHKKMAERLVIKLKEIMGWC